MTYTDYFGQPLSVGDEIVFPTHSGSQPKCYLQSKIIAIIPLVTHRDRGNYLMRQDQAHVKNPTLYPKISDPDKRFVVHVMKPPRWGTGPHKKFTVRYPENIIKAPV